MSNSVLSVESMALIYPLMFMFGFVSYLSHKFTQLYYSSLIENFYTRKSDKNLSEYFVVKVSLNSPNEDDEKFISSLMYNFDAKCVYKYFDEIYFLLKKNKDLSYSIPLYQIKEIIIKEIKCKSNLKSVDFDNLEENQITNYFKYLFYRNKFLWAKYLSRKYNIPIKNKDVNYFFKKNSNLIKENLPEFGQFYKFVKDENGMIISFKLFSFKSNKGYEELLLSDRIEQDTLKFSATDIHYIGNRDIDVYYDDDYLNQNNLDEFDELIKNIVKNVLDGETDETIEATLTLSKM